MKQKLGLVAALQHDPPLAILDEPTGGLDPVMQSRLLEFLDERARAGRTVLFSSHVLTEVEDLCDRVAMVRSGRLLLLRTVEEIRRERVRHVEVTFREPVDPARYAVAGVGPRRGGRGGPPFPRSAAIPRRCSPPSAALPVADVAIERGRLEDAFLTQYESLEPAPTP